MPRPVSFCSHSSAERKVAIEQSPDGRGQLALVVEISTFPDAVRLQVSKTMSPESISNKRHSSHFQALLYRLSNLVHALQSPKSESTKSFLQNAQLAQWNHLLT